MPNKSTLCRVRENLIRRRINIVVIECAAWANNNMITMIIIVIIVVKHLKTSTKGERHARVGEVVVAADSAQSRAREFASRDFVGGC